ncbi:BlaR1 family beta-lactam sensor/signal transducer [Paenactinomyces guangxiensis]|uniref:BlaR1 family beta-lactam sensor/signal transducer n=1 Tax=Paenactinomyces guangxiensis TaxID=1490290 RepID=A0A7W1WSS5_9BACL|nr:BlaR1 family beta-lactam sensor/signal transducer [Paenactinomyces guangxiensis]MBA4495400.1 BlaR1 family beta-lactam sensor/signal transducer [Paenactinomyces guangxiensis]MBH8592479.1 BlaR1 family beta-lactam sensor/signal transducer [Paenactinomyces guangxiensis]
METSSVFLTHFVIGFIVSSFTIAVIMLIKKVFQKQLSAKWQYNLWFLLLIALTLPFISNHLFNFGNHIKLSGVNNSNRIGEPTNVTRDHVIQNVNWLQDFTISVNRSTPDFLNIVIAGTWIAGVLVLTVLTIRAWLKIKDIKSNTSDLKNKEVLLLFEQCKQNLKLSRKINVGESPLVKSPLTFGLFKTYVVLPIHFEEWLSMKDIKYIFLHELNHYKYKDILTNYLIVIFQILYWFNPFVWFAFKEMRLDREIACDIAVLNLLDEHCYGEYGNTLINFVDRVSQPRNFILTNQLNGSKKQIKRRIEKIASFTTESKLMQLKSIAIFMLGGVFVASQVPFISVMAEDHTRYDFKSEQTVYEDLSEYFAGFEGSFVLYDMRADQYRIYNENKSILRVSPNSTYKIFSALFALESNVITSENTTMKWNGIQYPYDAWNMDQNLFTAMKNSVNWYFEDLDKRIQRDDMQAFLKQIGYGNTDLSGEIGQYWLESSLKISPVEQVQLLRALYTNQFGFKEKNVQTVQDAIRLEKKNGKQLSGKTGTGAVNNKNINGWFIGYVETKENTYFFATNIQNEDHANGSMAAEITLSILRDKGIY